MLCVVAAKSSKHDCKWCLYIIRDLFLLRENNIEVDDQEFRILLALS